MTSWTGTELHFSGRRDDFHSTWINTQNVRKITPAIIDYVVWLDKNAIEIQYIYKHTD